MAAPSADPHKLFARSSVGQPAHGVQRRDGDPAPWAGRADYFAANIGDPDGYNIEIAFKPRPYK